MDQRRPMSWYMSGHRRNTADNIILSVIVAGALLAAAVPRYLASQEREKAIEAFEFLSEVYRAQERHHDRLGSYAEKLSNLDRKLSRPKYFEVGEMKRSFVHNTPGEGWELRLTRNEAPFSRSKYWVTFNEFGYSPVYSSVPPSLFPIAAADTPR